MSDLAFESLIHLGSAFGVNGLGSEKQTSSPEERLLIESERLRLTGIVGKRDPAGSESET